MSDAVAVEASTPGGSARLKSSEAAPRISMFCTRGAYCCSFGCERIQAIASSMVPDTCPVICATRSPRTSQSALVALSSNDPACPFSMDACMRGPRQSMRASTSRASGHSAPPDSTASRNNNDPVKPVSGNVASKGPRNSIWARSIRPAVSCENVAPKACAILAPASFSNSVTSAPVNSACALISGTAATEPSPSSDPSTLR